MDAVNIAILVGTVVFLILLWIAVGVRHLKSLLHELDDQWEMVDEQVRKRHNLIPNLVETIRKYDFCDDKFMEKLIGERSLAVKEYYPGAKKMEHEHDLTTSINHLIGLSKPHKDLLQDTNFLELRTEIDDIEMDIESRSKKFNEMVRYYNRHRDSALLRPLSKVFGYEIVHIFEVET